MNYSLLQQHSRGLLKASELASILAVDPRTIRNWSEVGRIPVAYRAGSTIRFDLGAVKEALARETAEVQRKKLERKQSAKIGNSTPDTVQESQTPMEQ